MSKQSERDTIYRGNKLRIGDICLLLSLCSGRDTVRGEQLKIGYMLLTRVVQPRFLGMH